MRLKLNPKIPALVLIIFLSILSLCPAEENLPFKGKVNADKINVRSDSTIGSEVICTLSQGQNLDIIEELYDWYKIRLPRYAPAYIKKGIAECIKFKNLQPPNIPIQPRTDKDCQTLKVLKDRVNIRLKPNESSIIIGRVSKNEVIDTAGASGEWYKIVPTENCFGWVHKKFIDKVPVIAKQEAVELPKDVSSQDSITIEGIIKPLGKFFRRQATHKLIARDNKIFLLKAGKRSLNALSYQRVKITGKRLEIPKQKYPVIEIKTMEALD